MSEKHTTNQRNVYHHRRNYHLAHARRLHSLEAEIGHRQSCHKTLAERALMAWAALETYEYSHQELWRQTARRALDLTLTQLRLPGGAFAAEAEDRRVYPGANGLLLAALARGSQVLEEECYLRAAQTARLFIKTRLTAPEGYLYGLWTEGEPRGVGSAEDYAFYILGLTQLHRVSGCRFCLREALHLTDQMAALYGEMHD